MKSAVMVKAKGSESSNRLCCVHKCAQVAKSINAAVPDVSTESTLLLFLH